MSRRHLFAFFSMLFVSTAAMATDGKSCEEKSARMGASERTAYMKTCLAQMSESSNSREAQQQNKRARCEQNAKNQKLQGNDKDRYVSSCMTENEAAAAKAAPSPATEAKAAPAQVPQRAASRSGAKKSNSCVKQANKKGLKGDARRQFLKDCTPN